ncbi:MAG: hypothetical protein A3I97_02365 [Candidatus Taylorbacteria bacterium RIFCSPLOWO2_02_FULL_44_35]|nr:MAG: hypothetical protein A3I97_02365 [Candidatus Taylorbacteria bacterium RIFCSPLOWO2_02_FULL_44_35]
MLYLIYGNDFEKARGKARELIADLQKRKPNAGKLDELSGGQGLFERKYIVFADNVFRSAEAKEIVLKKLKSLADSENVFIFLEDELGKADLKELEKFAKKVQKFSGATNKEKPFNVFSLTEKLGRRDKRGLWILYQKALAEGLAPEEIHGILFWQIKAMLAAVLAKTAEESGLKPFVFQKSRVFAKNYSLAELKNLSSKMVAVYHNSRRIGPDLDVALERLILEI